MLRFLLPLFIYLFLCSNAYCRNDSYDIAYIWDNNLETVLDYKEELENLLGDEVAKNLRIVGRKDGTLGIIYDLNGTALSSAQTMVRHSEVLRAAGLADCFAVNDESYFQLYNVSYGLGPNLDALKKRYTIIYDLLGEEVGKNLFIEKTGSNNYTLIYRRRSDRESTYAVAKNHRKLLKRKKISTSITPENNNPVVFGESSHLDDVATEPSAVAGKEEGNEVKDVKEVIEVIEAAGIKDITITPPVQESVIPKVVAIIPEPKKQKPVAIVDTSSLSASNVEKSIEKYIGELRQKGKLDNDESTGWMVYDLTTGKSIVDINADQVFQAASMIKPFITLAFFHQVKAGKLTYGPKSRRNMEAMIQHSNNSATNWIMRYAGGPARCEEILQKYYGRIFHNTHVYEYIPSGGRTYKNSAIPSDYVRFLQALWKNELPYSKEIRRLMSLPGRDRLYDGTPIPKGTLVYNKTGSTAHLCGDMGILVARDRKGKQYPYALVGIIERKSRPDNYGNWMLTRGNVIREISTIVYEEMKKQYHLL